MDKRNHSVLRDGLMLRGDLCSHLRQRKYPKWQLITLEALFVNLQSLISARVLSSNSDYPIVYQIL